MESSQARHLLRVRGSPELADILRLRDPISACGGSFFCGLRDPALVARDLSFCTREPTAAGGVFGRISRSLTDLREHQQLAGPPATLREPQPARDPYSSSAQYVWGNKMQVPKPIHVGSRKLRWGPASRGDVPQLP